jgi:hypothetical protein
VPQTWEEYEAAAAKQQEKFRKESEKYWDPAKAPGKMETPKDLGGTKWRWVRRGQFNAELELRKDGTARHSKWDKPGTWTRLADGKILLKSETESFTITVTDMGKGETTDAQGRELWIFLASKPLQPADRESRLKPKEKTP